jgi:hypothetical protein
MGDLLKNTLIPEDFNWEDYLDLNKDLVISGIQSEEESINHYIEHGRFEKRLIKKIKIKPDPRYKGSSVFICGTSEDIEILEQIEIRNKIQEKFFVISINSSFHYFEKISTLFLNERFSSLSDSDLFGKEIGEIFSSSPIENITLQEKKYFSVDVQLNQYCPSISWDLNKTLPHGPTTLLDVVFPFCVFNDVKNIYLFGMNFSSNPKEYERHKNDSLYVKERNLSMNKELEMKFAHKKLKIWKDLFEKMEINCFSVSENNTTPFEGKNLEDIL